MLRNDVLPECRKLTLQLTRDLCTTEGRHVTVSTVGHDETLGGVFRVR
jgi:hypothetical protein